MATRLAVHGYKNALFLGVYKNKFEYHMFGSGYL
jgi:hypothetical protein